MKQKVKIISYDFIIEEEYDVNDIYSISIESGADLLEEIEYGTMTTPHNTKIKKTKSYLCVGNCRDGRKDVFSSDCYAKIDW